VQPKSIAAKSATVISTDKHKVNFHFGLVVKQHADQQRERVVVQQRVGDRDLDKLQFRHPNSLELSRKNRLQGVDWAR
jgi:hypothetical protein